MSPEQKMKLEWERCFGLIVKIVSDAGRAKQEILVDGSIVWRNSVSYIGILPQSPKLHFRILSFPVSSFGFVTFGSGLGYCQKHNLYAATISEIISDRSKWLKEISKSLEVFYCWESVISKLQDNYYSIQGIPTKWRQGSLKSVNISPTFKDIDGEEYQLKVSIEGRECVFKVPDTYTSFSGTKVDRETWFADLSMKSF